MERPVNSKAKSFHSMIGIVRPTEPPICQNIARKEKSDLRTVDKQNTLVKYHNLKKQLQPLSISSTNMHFMGFPEMQKMASIEVNVPSNNPGGTQISTPNDPRLGCLDDDELCSTCHQSSLDCPGHFGLITFNYHIPCALVASKMIYCLQCVCQKCAHLLVDEATIKENGILGIRDIDVRLKKLSDLSEGRRCKCQEDNEPIFYISNTFKTSYEIKFKRGKKNLNQKDSTELSTAEAQKILGNIPVAHLSIMGFENTNPANFILEGMLVIPIQARPYAVKEGERCSDFLTAAYDIIINTNNKIPKLEQEHDQEKLAKTKRDLYFFVSHFMNNSDGKMPVGYEEPLPSIIQRLTEKDGYIRGNAMGKRVNYCGRSIAGPGECDFGYINIPNEMKESLVESIIITSRNIGYVKELYNKKEVIGITNLNGQTIMVQHKLEKYGHLVAVGNTATIMGQDGDSVLGNRQPSLHKGSIMGYKTKYWNKKTIGLHSSNTNPLNADFDGDELNIHKSITVGSKIEMRHVADVGSCIMSSQTNSPVMGLVFNCPLSAMLLTQPHVLFAEETWNFAIQLLTDLKRVSSLNGRLEKHGIKMLSGVALFSTLLPEDFYYSHNGVLIQDGILCSGVITKSHIGNVCKSIVHYLYKKYSKAIVMRFFTEGQRLLDWYAEERGFTVGYSSCISVNKEEITKIISMETQKAQLQIDLLGVDSEEDSVVQKEYREKQIKAILDNASSIGKRMAKSAIGPDNPFSVMSTSGAKGNILNTVQIMGIMGQQYIKGSRPTLILNNKTRNNVYCVPGSKNIRYRGFIDRSFMDGMDPLNMLYHMMPSRMGLIDTAIRTADIGHLHHRINKVLEDVVIAYDGSVRNVSGTIFQFSFSDGFNSGELIPTSSIEGDNICNFIDLKNVVGEINLKYGHINKDLDYNDAFTGTVEQNIFDLKIEYQQEE